MRRGIDTLISGAAILATLAACSPLRPESTPTNAPRTMEIVPTPTLPSGVLAELGSSQITRETVEKEVDAKLDAQLIEDCGQTLDYMYTHGPAQVVQLPAPANFSAQMNILSQQIEGTDNLAIGPNLTQTSVKDGTVYFSVDLYYPPSFDETSFAAPGVARHECTHFAQYVRLMQHLLEIQQSAPPRTISDEQILQAFNRFFYSKGKSNFLEPAATYVEIATALKRKKDHADSFKRSSYHDPGTYGGAFYDLYVNTFGEDPPSNILPDTTTKAWEKWSYQVRNIYP